MNSARDTAEAVGFPIRTSPGKLVCQLTDAFRRLPRPSSPSAAQASTICAYSLDHITPRSRGHTVAVSRVHECDIQNKHRNENCLKLGVKKTSNQIVKELVRALIAEDVAGAPSRRRTPNKQT